MRKIQDHLSKLLGRKIPPSSSATFQEVLDDVHQIDESVEEAMNAMENVLYLAELLEVNKNLLDDIRSAMEDVRDIRISTNIE